MLILPSWLITSAKEKPLAGWGVRFVDSEISAVAPNEALKERYADEEIWDAAG